MLRLKDAHLETVRQTLRRPQCILQTSLGARQSFTSTTYALTAASSKKGRLRAKLRAGREASQNKARGKARETAPATEQRAREPGLELPDIAPDPLSPFFGYSTDFSENVHSREKTKIGAWMSLTDRLRDGRGDSMALLKIGAGQGATDHQQPKNEQGAPSAQVEASTRKKSSQVEKKAASPGKKSSTTARKGPGKKSNSARQTINPAKIKNKPVETDAELDVPKLQHNLDRVLFNPGVHVMRDERSRVYNFDPEIAEIMPASEFDYDALGEYITSSKDEKLRELCAKYNKKYCGSTSSLSSILAHFHYLISAWRKPNFKQLSGSIKPDSNNFTNLLRSPAAAFAHYRDGSYAIDADKEYDMDNILSSLGKSMEKHLLLPKEEFDKYRRTRSHEISEEQRNAGESYHYSELGDFLVRSQLDAYDPRLPGTGVFDIKTRAVISIRMDVMGYEKGTGYEINQLRGQWHSFEREYLDMIRAAFLKYSLQVRMGRMDGIFCAYHNTQRIFGFQYIPLSEMDVALHGTEDTRLGDDEFKASLTMLNALLNKASQRWPGRTLRLHVETRDTVIPLMYFFVQPVTEEAMTAIQMANKSSVAASTAKVVAKLKDLQASLDEPAAEEAMAEKTFEEETSDISDENSGSGPEADEVWDELMSKIGDVIENDTNGLESVKAAIVSALDRQRLLEGKSESEAERYIDTLMEALVGSLPDEKSAGTINGVAETEAEDVEDAETSVAREYASEDRDKSTETASDEEDKSTLRDSYVSTESRGVDLVEEGKVASNDAEVLSPRFSETQEPPETQENSQATEAMKDPETLDDDRTRTDADLAPEPSGLSLKELVLRAAANADNKSGELRTFERVFAELLAEAKAKDPEKEEAFSIDEDASHSPGPKSEEPAANVQGTDTQPSGKSLRKNLEERELLGMVVTVKNNVDGKYKDRPEGNYRKWAIEYSVTELDDEKAWAVYSQIKKRRAQNLSFDRARRDADWYTMFRGDLQRATMKSKELRKKLEKEDRERKTIHVAWDEAPRPFKQG